MQQLKYAEPPPMIRSNIGKTSKPTLNVSGLHFSYGDKDILKGINFSVSEGEVIGIVGESGSGKTSLLKLLGGLLKPQRGELLFDGKPIPGPEQRLVAGHDRIKLVSQDFDLMPYLSVKDNMLRNSLSRSDSERKKLIGHFNKKLKLRGVADNRATDTSGGQKQRVAWATALSARPDVLLLDEPFSNLDYPLKMELIHLLKTEWKPRAMIVVTHEPADILRLADRIMVMHKGRIIQKGTAREVYENPKNEMVAKLLGPVNVLSPEEAALFGIETEKEVCLRPHEFKIGKGGVKVEVVRCDYVGFGHEVIAYLGENTKLIFTSPKNLKNAPISLILNV